MQQKNTGLVQEVVGGPIQRRHTCQGSGCFSKTCSSIATCCEVKFWRGLRYGLGWTNGYVGIVIGIGIAWYMTGALDISGGGWPGRGTAISGWGAGFVAGCADPGSAMSDLSHPGPAASEIPLMCSMTRNRPSLLVPSSAIF